MVRGGEGGGRKFARASDLQQVPLYDRARARPRKREDPVANVFVRASVLHTTPGAFSRWWWDNPLTLLAGVTIPPIHNPTTHRRRSPTAVAGFYRRVVSFCHCSHSLRYRSTGGINHRRRSRVTRTSLRPRTHTLHTPPHTRTQTRRCHQLDREIPLYARPTPSGS